MLNLPLPRPFRAQKLTPVSNQDLYLALQESHESFFGSKAPKNRLLSAWAHVGLENGQGDLIYNFNFGNIGGSKREPYFFINGHPFKSNESIHDGTVLYWKTIKKMCSSVLPYFDVGDTHSAAYQLYRCGYYRADRDVYARGMSKLFWKARKTF